MINHLVRPIFPDLQFLIILLYCMYCGTSAVCTLRSPYPVHKITNHKSSPWCSPDLLGRENQKQQSPNCGRSVWEVPLRAHQHVFLMRPGLPKEVSCNIYNIRRIQKQNPLH